MHSHGSDKFDDDTAEWLERNQMDLVIGLVATVTVVVLVVLLCRCCCGDKQGHVISGPPPPAPPGPVVNAPYPQQQYVPYNNVAVSSPAPYPVAYPAPVAGPAPALVTGPVPALHMPMPAHAYPTAPAVTPYVGFGPPAQWTDHGAGWGAPVPPAPSPAPLYAPAPSLQYAVGAPPFQPGHARMPAPPPSYDQAIGAKDPPYNPHHPH